MVSAVPFLWKIEVSRIVLMKKCEIEMYNQRECVYQVKYYLLHFAWPEIILVS